MSRSQLYTLFIVLAAAMMFGKIAAVDRVDLQQLQQLRLNQIEPRLAAKEKNLRRISNNEEQIQAELEKTRRNLFNDAVLQSPMFCGNDRSRWATIRALVEPDMRVVRTVPGSSPPQYEYVWYAIDTVQNIKGWDTIDMVKHPLEPDSSEAYLFSSKPPLLPTLMAIPYAALYWGSGQQISLGTDPYFVVRTLLVLLNLIPLVFCWILLIRMIERFGTTDWGRIFTAAAVCFGTFLPTFSVTLNNHLPAVVAVTAAFYCVMQIILSREQVPHRGRNILYAFAAGLCAFFATACELPALSFCVFLGILLTWFTALPFLKTPEGEPPKIDKMIPASYCLGILVVVLPFFVTNYAAHRTLLPAYSQPSWYFFEYERAGLKRHSYWKNPLGIDQGEPSRTDYIFHSTVGHHGIFLLTPIWFLTFLGLGIGFVKNEKPTTFSSSPLKLSALMTLALSVIVFGFYMMQEQPNRNYGGMTSALRWMFWLIPLWLVPLVFAADKLSERKSGRALALFLLAFSIFSCTYPVWNPWTHPWIYHLLFHLGVPILN